MELVVLLDRRVKQQEIWDTTNLVGLIRQFLLGKCRGRNPQRLRHHVLEIGLAARELLLLAIAVLVVLAERHVYLLMMILILYAEDCVSREKRN